MSGFWGSLFSGKNDTLSGDMTKTGDLADFSSAQGKQNTTAASKFNNSILSGDSTKISQTLAPQVSSLKTSTNQDQKTASQNGSRSGGTAASNTAKGDKVHSDVTSLTGGLTAGAASSLMSSGDSLLKSATSGYGQQAALSSQQEQQWANSILGLGVTSKIGGLEGYMGGIGAG